MSKNDIEKKEQVFCIFNDEKADINIGASVITDDIEITYDGEDENE